MNMLNGRSKLILALDVEEVSLALKLAGDLSQSVGTMKVGPGLFVDGGKSLISDVKKTGAGLFLDLKLYDIPETVARAVRRITAMGVDMLTLHASGGSRMISAAKEAVTKSGGNTKLLAVTVLTSFDAGQLKKEWKMEETVEERVIHLAKIARDAGADGIVCSPLELPAIRRELGPDFLAVIPGIRSASDPADDQRRTLSAPEAIKAGASYLVVGRPILKAADPKKAAEEMSRQIEEAMK
jgi:orotidine-5'-phosphate decarboxylase